VCSVEHKVYLHILFEPGLWATYLQWRRSCRTVVLMPHIDGISFWLSIYITGLCNTLGRRTWPPSYDTRHVLSQRPMSTHQAAQPANTAYQASSSLMAHQHTCATCQHDMLKLLFNQNQSSTSYEHNTGLLTGVWCHFHHRLVILCLYHDILRKLN